MTTSSALHRPAGRAAFGRPALILAATLALLAPAAHADEREDLEKLRATVLGLIDVLVKSGVVPRDKVDAMMREAQRNADVQLAKAPAPEVGPDGKKIVRVPYVPEAVRTQMREQIKAEVLAQTALAPAGGGAPVTESGARVRIEGDVRLRAEAVRLAADNSAATAFAQGSPDLTRAPDLWAAGNSSSFANTEDPFNRTRVRARLGVDVAVSDTVNAGIALATGSATGPTSTNQTMAQGASQTPGFFNKYGLVVDRAYIRVEPMAGLMVSGGRFRNPFMATDLVWADDLNFEGLAVAWKGRAAGGFDAFVTGGWFPLATETPGVTGRRTLTALQGGVDWTLGLRQNHLKLAAALYDYRGIEGVKETTTDKSTVPDYVTRSEYGAGYRQRGNTLFRINTLRTVDSATNWGLASGFRELDLTAVFDLSLAEPTHLITTIDLVRNLGFDRAEIQRRSGLAVSDGNATGFLGKVQFGAPATLQRGLWNVSLAYRRLGSDAVLDAFTNSDFGQGGTNNRGFTLAGNVGIAKNTWLGARWMSSELIDSAVPQISGSSARTKFSVDTLQLELNARF